MLLDLFVGVFVISIISQPHQPGLLLDGYAAPGLAQGVKHGPRPTILLPILLASSPPPCPRTALRPGLLPIAAACHLVASLSAVFSWPSRRAGEGALALSWLGPRRAGQAGPPPRQRPLFLLLVYCVGYLRYRQERSNRVFVACLLVFLGAVSLAAWSQHLGLIWVAIEATTLSTAPLIYFNRSKRSIEATWKYLLVCSVGIALALLGTFFLAYSAIAAGLPSLLDERRSSPRGGRALQALAAGRLRPPPRRLRHQDGARADAHLEARRLRRGAGRRRGHLRGRRHELRLPRLPARLPDLRGGGEGAFVLAPPPRHGPLLDGGGRASS